MYQFLSLPSDNAHINGVIEDLFGGTSTFRKGQIGAWKTELNDVQKEDIHASTGDIIYQLGYESV